MRVPKKITPLMVETEKKIGESLSTFLNRKYHQEWATINDLAQELDLDYSQLRLWFKFFNIKTRGSGKVRRLEKINFSEECKQILYGSILGDGHLFLPTETTHYAFSEKHSLKQKSYLHWKAEQLMELSPCICFVKDESAYTTDMYIMRTSACQFFTSLRHEMYPQGIKIIPTSLLTRLQPLALAIWFMDDGSIYHESSYKEGSRYFEWRLYTNGFDLDSIHRTIRYFESTHNIHPTIIPGNGGSALRFKKTDTIKLMEMTKEFFPECMRYKLETKCNV